MLKFDIEKCDVRKTTNVDFIGTVELNDKSVVYRTYPIVVPHKLFILLQEMVCDDSKSVLNMQAAFDRFYPRTSELAVDPNFLAPLRLDASYVEPVRVPERITRNAYLQRKHEIKKQAAESNGKENVSMVPVKVNIEKWLIGYRRKLKKRFFDQFVRFQGSYGYGVTLEKFRIKERLGHEVRMFSTDTIGWTTYNYVINQDVSIRLDSNFGYGRSSYFLLSILYRGMEIYTFSDYVKYPYANMRALISHTRTYRVERDSWPDALEFVAETANAAVCSPQTFMETFILGEVQKMMMGLRKILQMKTFPEKVCEAECCQPLTGAPTSGHPKYLGVSTKGLTTNFYKATPNEMLLVLKSERIIGVLAVLEKLKALDVIAANVAETIEELIGMVNVRVLELEQGIKSVRKEICSYEYELGSLRAIWNCVDARFRLHKLALQMFGNAAVEELDARAEEEFGIRNRVLEEVRKKYIAENPECKRIQNIVSKIAKEVNSMQEHITQRRVFLEVLAKCYGVGKNGERFWTIVEKLYPHEVEIEKEVMRQVSNLLGKKSIRGIDGLRDSVRAKYCADHTEVGLLFTERDSILDGIDTFSYCRA